MLLIITVGLIGCAGEDAESGTSEQKIPVDTIHGADDYDRSSDLVITGRDAASDALSGTQNLALGKPAAQSSTAFGAPAARAVDGNTNGNWGDNSVTHTNSEAQPWWQVDLGTVIDIGQVVLYNRTDCCSERLADFDVWISDNGIAWQIGTAFAGIAPTRTALSINGPARFVRVQLRGTNPLSLAEVQIFPPENLAAGKSTAQSSTAFGASASRAVDGNTNGNWGGDSVTHTNSEAQPWWQVDLGAVAEIGRVVLYNRTDCCSDRLSNFRILASNDGRSWSVIASMAGVAPPRAAFATGASARFVRVQLLGTNPLSLAEVQVLPSQNFAAGKTTRQSSTAFDGNASRAVDGNTDGNWSNGSVTHTGFEAGAWWQVDLGAVTSLGKAILYNRTDCCSDRLSNFELLISNDGAIWSQVGTFPGASAARIVFPIYRAGRFVRVHLLGANNLSLAEVQVTRP